MSVVQRVIDENAAVEAQEPYLKAWAEREGQPMIVRLPLDRGRVIVGRLPECDLELGDDAQASRHHATLEASLNAWYVSDARSTNGTLLNRVELESPTRLTDGDDLCFGETCFTYRDPRPVQPGDVTVRPRRYDIKLTAAQARVLVELCRPVHLDRDAHPATNPEIAKALTVEVQAVKATLNTLYRTLGLTTVPAGEKRRRLALLALDFGLIRRHDLKPS